MLRLYLRRLIFIVIRVCDAIMGAGKTMAAITEMNERTDTRFVFVTPYLDEVRRIREACPGRRFAEPDAGVCGTKLRHFKSLVRAERNIACTHALFRDYDSEALDDIERIGYTLVLDEAITVIEVLPVSKRDVEMMLSCGLIREDSVGRVVWADDEYNGQYYFLRDAVDSGYVTLEDGKLLFWMLPPRMFEVFRDIVILTYMFDTQPLSYYFKANNMDIHFIGTECGNDGIYRFTDKHSPPKIKLPPIHILEDKSLNSIGDKRTALSMNWYKTSPEREITKLKNAIYNVVRNKYNVKSSQCLWTTYAGFQRNLTGKGYGRSYATWNMRATNRYSDRTHVIYAVNVFPNPDLMRYFRGRGVIIDQDAWALSEMIQWIWRSAIRRGDEIWIYVPSSRMRALLKKWIKEVSLP